MPKKTLKEVIDGVLQLAPMNEMPSILENEIRNFFIFELLTVQEEEKVDAQIIGTILNRFFKE